MSDRHVIKYHQETGFGTLSPSCSAQHKSVFPATDLNPGHSLLSSLETMKVPWVAGTFVNGLGCAAAFATGLVAAVSCAMALYEEELQRLGEAAEEGDFRNRRLGRGERIFSK